MRLIVVVTYCRCNQLTTSNCRSTNFRSTNCRFLYFSFTLLTEKLNSQYCPYYITLTIKIHRFVIVRSLFSKNRIVAKKMLQQAMVLDFYFPGQSCTALNDRFPSYLVRFISTVLRPYFDAS